MPRKPRYSILAASAIALIAPQASADVLDQFTFGTGSTSILTPTTVAPGVATGAITGNAGVTLDLSNSQANPPPSAPWLRVVPVAANDNPDKAIAADASFQFTLATIPGFSLNLSSLTFDMMRGGGGTRGYALRSSLDNFGTTISTAAALSQRGDAVPFRNFSTDLTGSTYQNLSSITFKIYSYSAASGSSVEYDNITLNGTATFSGYTWQGASNAWNTTSANWSSAGGQVYQDNLASSNVLFSDAGTASTVDIATAGLRPNLITFTNSVAKDYTFTGGSLNVAASFYKSGAGKVTINNAVSASSVTAETGTLDIGTTGTLSSSNITVSPTGKLVIQKAGALSATSGLTVNGPLELNNPTPATPAIQKIATLNGAATGVVNLNDSTLEVTGTSTYAGLINGNGVLVKSTDGVLTLGGNNGYYGGTTITGGALQLNHTSAAGIGSIIVNTGGVLSFGAANIGNEVTLAGGTLGVTGAGRTITNYLTVTAPSTIKTFDPVSGTTGNDLILNGMLQGSGNLTIQSVNGNNPDGAAFRLRGPASEGATAYTGTITVGQSAKFELQTAQESGSPMGTGKLVVTGGTTSTTVNGTYSIINVRNNNTFSGNTTFGNNVEVTGTGTSYFNMLGDAVDGSVSKFGDLRIGNGQGIAAVATSTTKAFTLAFDSVHLTGGNATFTPKPVGNTTFLATQNITLGAITQEVAGSGITMDGAATLTLTGTSTYTGPTVVQSGILAVNGSISGSTVALNGGILQGIGTTGPVNVIGGTLAPGNGAGTLNTGSLTFAGGTLSLEIGGNTPGSYDQVNVAGGLTLNASVSLSLGLTFDPVDGVDKFVIINNDSGDLPTFASANARFFFGPTQLNEGTVFTVQSGAFTQDFAISYVGGTNGNDVVLTAVPEPGTATALLIGFGMLAGARRRRR